MSSAGMSVIATMTEARGLPPSRKGRSIDTRVKNALVSPVRMIERVAHHEKNDVLLNLRAVCPGQLRHA